MFGCIGGLFLSLATTLNFYLKGRITGMSGLLKDLIVIDFMNLTNTLWKLSCLFGMISSAAFVYKFGGSKFFPTP